MLVALDLTIVNCTFAYNHAELEGAHLHFFRNHTSHVFNSVIDVGEALGVFAL